VDHLALVLLGSGIEQHAVVQVLHGLGQAIQLPPKWMLEPVIII
jgi:hypothetical protein